MCITRSAKPIDLLAKYINTTEEDMDIEMQEPYHLLIASENFSDYDIH